jgi:hypothetical protein
VKRSKDQGFGDKGREREMKILSFAREREKAAEVSQLSFT